MVANSWVRSGDMAGTYWVDYFPCVEASLKRRLSAGIYLKRKLCCPPEVKRSLVMRVYSRTRLLPSSLGLLNFSTQLLRTSGSTTYCHSSHNPLIGVRLSFPIDSACCAWIYPRRSVVDGSETCRVNVANSVNRWYTHTHDSLMNI